MKECFLLFPANFLHLEDTCHGDTVECVVRYVDVYVV